MITTASAEPWVQQPSLPEPNAGFVAGAVNQTIYVLGGTNWEGGKKNWLQTVHRLEVGAKQWTTLAPLKKPLAYGIGANHADQFVVAGGYNGDAPSELILKIGSGGAVMPEGIHLEHATALSAGGRIGEELILIGGTADPNSVEGLLRLTRAINLTTGKMRPLEDYPGPGVGTAASGVVGTEIFVFAGANWDAGAKRVKNSTDAFAFSPQQNRWRSLRAYPLAVRGVSAVVLDDHRVYLAGGYAQDDFVDRAFIYDTRSDEYEEAVALPYRGQVGLVRCGEFVYCLGGEDRMKHRSSAVHRIRTATLLKSRP